MITYNIYSCINISYVFVYCYREEQQRLALRRMKTARKQAMERGDITDSSDEETEQSSPKQASRTRPEKKQRTGLPVKRRVATKSPRQSNRDDNDSDNSDCDNENDNSDSASENKGDDDGDDSVAESKDDNDTDEVYESAKKARHDHIQYVEIM